MHSYLSVFGVINDGNNDADDDDDDDDDGVRSLDWGNVGI